MYIHNYALSLDSRNPRAEGTVDATKLPAEGRGPLMALSLKGGRGFALAG